MKKVIEIFYHFVKLVDNILLEFIHLFYHFLGWLIIFHWNKKEQNNKKGNSTFLSFS